MLGIKKVLKAISALKSVNTQEDYKAQVITFFKDSKIVNTSKYGYCITLQPKAFYKVKSLSFKYDYLDNVKLVSHTVLKALEGYSDYVKSIKK